MKPIPPTEAALVQALLEILWLMTRQTKSSRRFSLGEGTQKRVEKKALIWLNRGIRWVKKIILTSFKATGG